MLGYGDSALSSHISVYLDAGGRNQSLHKAGQSLPSQQTVSVLPDDGWGLYLYISTIRPLIAEFFSRRFHKWKHFCRISFPSYSNLDFSDIICKMLPEKKKKKEQE